MAKRKEKKKEPPVVTGHDGRAKENGGKKRFFERESDAPDGVSGNWS